MSGMQCDIEGKALRMARESRAFGMSAAETAERISDKLELEPHVVARVVLAAWFGDPRR